MMSRRDGMMSRRNEMVMMRELVEVEEVIVTLPLFKHLRWWH